MHSTKNDLSEATRQSMITLLQGHLADGIDLIYQAKQAHWNVKGPSFKELHELFDELYDEVREYTDMIAERLVSLGGQAHGTVRVSAAQSRLPEYPLDMVYQEGHIEAISSAVSLFAQHTRASISASSDLGDEASADLFTEITRGLDKTLWMIEASSSKVGQEEFKTA